MGGIGGGERGVGFTAGNWSGGVPFCNCGGTLGPMGGKGGGAGCGGRLIGRTQQAKVRVDARGSRYKGP